VGRWRTEGGTSDFQASASHALATVGPDSEGDLIFLMSRNEESGSSPRVVEASTTRQQAVIEIVSDVVCPWCFIGKRRLEKALALLDRPDVRFHWMPFELNPDAPKHGMDRQAHRARKFGSLARAQELEARVAAAGAEEGIQFRFDRIQKIPNTFEAHRLIWFAGRDGVQDALVERLFRAYFIDAKDVGEVDVLKRIGTESGLGGGRLDELFAKRVGTEDVIADERTVRLRGVNSVPTFFVGGEPVTSGAHKPALLAMFLGQALGPGLSQCSQESGVCG
jgi:predicted DsbA family dithiol-disulfide isomerase